MATTKKEFHWDKEKLISTIEISEYEKRETRICELKGKEYVVFTTLKNIKGEWRPTGGYSLPKAHWPEIAEAIGDHSFKPEAAAKTKVTTKKKTTSKKGSKKDE